MAGSNGGAPEGNNNNRKWTLVNAQALIEDIAEYVQNNEDCFSMAKVCTELGYYETVLDHIKKSVPDVNLEPIKKAKATIKARLIHEGLIGNNNPTMSIFVLKNNHGMRDKTEVTNTTMDLTPLTDEERKKAKEDLDSDY